MAAVARQHARADRCRRLTDAELISLDRVLERKLWQIDRADIHAVTGGSDDGFLYARGFIVAMGRAPPRAPRPGTARHPPSTEPTLGSTLLLLGFVLGSGSL